MFPMPPAAQFAAAMARLGVGDGTRVVLYDDMASIWAARVWWMLGAFGFDDAAVLDGGWTKWTREGRPVSDRAAALSAGAVRRAAAPGADRREGRDAGSHRQPGHLPHPCARPDEYAGRGPARYGRPGHIPSSVNVSFLGVLDPETHAYLPRERLEEQFRQAGALQAERVITYCGGGIASSSDAFLLTLLGVGDVAVYDGSLTEWAADPALPLVTGEA